MSHIDALLHTIAGSEHEQEVCWLDGRLDEMFAIDECNLVVGREHDSIPVGHMEDAFGEVTPKDLPNGYSFEEVVTDRRRQRRYASPTGVSNAPAIVASSRHFPRSSCRLAPGEIHRQRPDRYRPDQ